MVTATTNPKLRNFGDVRQRAWCICCGGGTETKDHLPPRVFLDEPYPPDLPVVRACGRCNNLASADEEYAACLVGRGREKVERILRKKPSLAAQVRDGRQYWRSWDQLGPVTRKLENVALKLARGHAVWDLNEPQFERPEGLWVAPLELLSADARRRFEAPPQLTLLPEMGSRAMQRAVMSGAELGWVTVQPGRYRYLATVSDGSVIRIVLGEFLACEIVWPW